MVMHVALTCRLPLFSISNDVMEAALDKDDRPLAGAMLTPKIRPNPQAGCCSGLVARCARLVK